MTVVQPCPEPILVARTALTQALLSRPDLSVALALEEALNLLEDVQPPYAPLPHVASAPVTVSVLQAGDALERAIDVAATPQQAVQLGLAARLIRSVLPGTPT